MLVDDLDELLNSTHPHYMPALDRTMRQAGTRMPDFTVSTPLCCPARTILLTGQYAHCTKVITNYGADGGYAKFAQEKVDKSYLPTWLQSAGYSTYLVGKFLNGYGEGARPSRPPAGWTVFDALTGASTYHFMEPCFRLNGGPKNCYDKSQGMHQVDIIRDKAIALLRSHQQDAPFFMYLTPTAPHREQVGLSTRFVPPTPAARHANLYANENITSPRSPNWGLVNPAIAGDFNLTKAIVKDMDQLYLARLRVLRAVDEMLDALVTELKALGQLDNTYVVFSSDNGYHLGSFGLSEGKALPIEEDIRVPFYIRGPGLGAGQQVAQPGSFVDVAPTVMALAGLPVPASVNGLTLPLAPALLPPYHAALLATLTPGSEAVDAIIASGGALDWWRRDSLLLEMWNMGKAASTNNQKNNWIAKGLRLCTDYKVFPDSGDPQCPGPAPGLCCYKYLVWCSGGRQFYDLSTDPYETRDRSLDLPPRLLDRFDAIMSTLAHCDGAECRNPYAVLHPGQPVFNLTGAADPMYDKLYGSLTKFRFRTCSKLYSVSNEVTWTTSATNGA